MCSMDFSILLIKDAWKWEPKFSHPLSRVQTWYWYNPQCAAAACEYLGVVKDATCLIMKLDMQRENTYPTP